MCGIIGHYKVNDLINLDTFNEMRDSLSHRGPDGAGTARLNSGSLALGHRRLSIIDLSNAGSQPMANKKGTVWLTFNGEIYNFKVLREELEQEGYQFLSQTDSEVLIHGYQEWGFQMLLSKIKGMFALVIWDKIKKKLFGARDRFGIKPLYYFKNNTDFIFASEIKGILKEPSIQINIDFTAVADFLVYRFIPSPKSIYQEIRKLPPAHYFELDLKSYSLEIERYWSLDTKLSSSITSDVEIREECERLIGSSVKEHLISDVPVGVFLSGGQDSSTITYFMRKLGYPTQSFTIGFENWQNSEHLDASLVAKKYGTTHYELILDQTLGEDLQQTAYHFDEPLGGSSFLPTFEVSKLATDKVKVVLGGDGGDEIFAGYRWHYKVLEDLGRLKGIIKNYLVGGDFLLEKYHKYMDWSGFDYRSAKNLLGKSLEENYSPSELWLYKEFDDQSLSPIKRLQLLDLNTFLPEVVNTKVDRASMAHSLEVRVPFLDHHLVEFLFSLPSKSYYQKGTNKKLLSQIINPHLPQSLVKKKKQGFGAPLSRSINLEEKLSNGSLVENGVIERKFLNEYIAQGQFRKLWAIYILENWFRCWIE